MFDTSVVDGVTLVELSHGKANAMDLEFCTGLTELLGRLEADGQGAVVLTGRGSIFSAGVDLIRLTAGGPAYAREFVPALEHMAHALFTFRRPLVAAVNGHAVAGGCVMACAADFRLMAEGSGRIGVPELRVGVPFPAVALEIMREAVTAETLRTLVFEAGLLDASAARAIGLIDAVVAPDALRDNALEHAARLARVEPDVFAVTKAQMRRPALDRIAALDSAYSDAVYRVWANPRALDNVRAYIDRTFRRTRD